MSCLRLMGANPELSCARDIPKWKDTRKIKISVVFAKQNVFQKLFGHAKEFFEKHQSEIKWFLLLIFSMSSLSSLSLLSLSPLSLSSLSLCVCVCVCVWCVS